MNTSLLMRHGAAWMDDKWYRRAFFIGPQALGLFAIVVLLAWDPPPVEPAGVAHWIHPIDMKGRIEQMNVLRNQARTDTKAETLLNEKAQEGDAIAQFFMGTLNDPTIDRSKASAERTTMAVAWYRKAAEQNMVQAQANLGFILAHESLGMADYPDAFRWLDKAAPRIPQAQRELALLYRLGHGVPVDQVKAMELMRAAADHGDAAAQSILADALDRGSDGLTIDH